MSIADYTIKTAFRKIPLSEKVRGYFQVIRIYTLLAPFVGGFSAACMALGHLPGTLIESASVIAGGFILAGLNAASNSLNQVTDLDADRISKPYRPLPSGRLSIDEALSAAWMLYLVAVAGSFLLNAVFGALTLALAILSVFYSMPPIRLKKRLWLGNLNLGITRGILGFMAGWSIFGNPFDNIPVILGGLFSVYMFGANVSKDFPDISGDAATGVRTLPVVYGVTTAARISVPFYVVPFPLLASFIFAGLLPFKLLSLFLVMPFSCYAAWKLIHSPTETLVSMENNKPWLLMYATLAGAYIISLLTILYL